MNLRKRLLKNSRLYLVLDKGTAGVRDLTKIAVAAIRGGVDIIQLRWKRGRIEDMLDTGKKLKKIALGTNVLFIVDDDPVFAYKLGADGVHLGHEDISIKAARAILGPDAIIGYSTHSPAQAERASMEDVDYISVGPIFKTPTKASYKPVGPARLGQIIKRVVRKPVFAIGGIDLRNIREITEKGAARIAVVRAIVKARDPETASRRLKDRLP